MAAPLSTTITSGCARPDREGFFMLAEAPSPIRIVDQTTVWKRFIHLRTLVIEQIRADGRVERLDREVHDHGAAATVLLVDPARQSVILVRQFRPGAFL